MFFFFFMPVTVKEKQREFFLWKGSGEKKELHLMKWCNVIKPTSAEGFGS